MKKKRQPQLPYLQNRTAPVESVESEVLEATLLEELASGGAPLEDVGPDRRTRAAEFWMQEFIDNGVRPPLDVVRVFMAEYRSMWQRLNKGKHWDDRKYGAAAKVQHWRFIASAVLAAAACGRTSKIEWKTFLTAQGLLRHFGIPGCENLTEDTIRQTWERHPVRPDDDLIEIFVYAQREGHV